jgi:putative DNA primase/helicase
MASPWPDNVRPFTDIRQDTADEDEAGLDLDSEPHRSQVRMALRLAAAEVDRLLHVPGLGWHAWDGARWAPDTGDRHAKQAVIRAVKQARLDAARMRSNKERDDLWSDAKSCETATGVRGVLEIAAALPPLSALAHELDQGAYLLNTPRQTLDLRTGSVHPCNPQDRLTKATGCVYDAEASSEAWEDFLTATLPDEEVRRFLQRVVGLSLVGRVIEHVLPILTGSGRNGKGTFVRTVASALGDYAIETEPDLFMARERAHPTGLLDLRGVRFATCQETDAGRRLDVAVVKRLTGGDTIRARRMRQDYIEFAPSHQPFLITNHLPKVPADDPALWARLLVVPFGQSFLGREDRGLEERLAKDLSAVLAWAVAGWVEYQRLGSLEPPESVTAATSSYRVNNDHLAQFIEDRCLLNPHMHVMSSALWSEWEAWCTASNVRPGTNRTFKADLEAHGIIHERGMHGVRYRGIGLAGDE